MSLLDWFNNKRAESPKIPQWALIDEPQNVISGRGMVHPDERRLLYILARDYFSGAGVIIDGGTFAGSSSLALGLGLKDRGFPRRKVIHAFDTFIIDAGAEITLDRNDPLSAEIKGGDSIRPLYDRNVAEVASYIEVHHGDVLQEPWSGRRIEILFCDICKMLPINDYVLEQWIARLIPGRGLLIQQDQVQEHHVWIAISMSILSDYFEIVDFVPHSTMIYRLKRKIPRKILKKALDRNVTPELMERHYLRSLETFRALDVPHRKRWHLGNGRAWPAGPLRIPYRRHG